MEKKLQKIYLTYNNLLIAQGLCRTHYQILSNVNRDTIIKHVEFLELDVSIETVFLKT